MSILFSTPENVLCLSVGEGRRVQPNDEIHEEQSLLHPEIERLNEELRIARAEMNGVSAWELLNQTEKVGLIAKTTNGDCPSDDELAELIGYHRSTMSSARKGLGDAPAA